MPMTMRMIPITCDARMAALYASIGDLGKN
jgi:hypothetical protein